MAARDGSSGTSGRVLRWKRLLLAALTTLCAGLPAEAQQRSGCQTCHEKEHRAEEAGVHARGAAQCTDCHGGDSGKQEREPAHGAALETLRDRRRIPEACARCHSDARRMNPTGLPVDQLSRYLTSKHGEALARGNLDVAVCTDCHGAHGMRGARDSSSSVHPANIPDTCGRCHSDQKLMARHQRPSDAEAAYRGSVHGLLLARGDLSAPTCATCHGNHGAVPPGFAEVGQACGQCHVQQLAFFKESPHAFYAETGGFRGCAECHSNHAIVREPAEIAQRCSVCHEPGEQALKTHEAVRNVLDRQRTALQQGRERLTRLERIGLHVQDEEGLFAEARTRVSQLPPLQHVLKEDRLAPTAKEAGALLEGLARRLDGKEAAEGRKKLALIPVWGFLLIMSWIFWRKHGLVEGRAGSDAQED